VKNNTGSNNICKTHLGFKFVPNIIVIACSAVLGIIVINNSKLPSLVYVVCINDLGFKNNSVDIIKDVMIFGGKNRNLYVRTYCIRSELIGAFISINSSYKGFLIVKTYKIVATLYSSKSNVCTVLFNVKLNLGVKLFESN
jgi:hypothetical protein